MELFVSFVRSVVLETSHGSASGRNQQKARSKGTETVEWGRHRNQRVACDFYLIKRKRRIQPIKYRCCS